MNAETNLFSENDKRVVYCVNPPCISENRAMQYIQEAERLYKSGKLPSNITVKEEEDCIIVTYNR